ncbi:MAG TPA: pseudouridine synthase [Thermoprotei archaeon]|nr:pseudouridine synthase [Thermoprotei archaeon]
MDLIKIRAIANYQYGHGVGDILFSRGNDIFISRASTGRIRYIYLRDCLIAVLRASDFMLLFSIKGAQLVKEAVPPPALRVVVRNDVARFIAEGKSVFAKHVVDVDKNLRAGDEVLVVDEDDNLLAVGRLVLSPLEIFSYKWGLAVRVRKSIGLNDSP